MQSISSEVVYIAQSQYGTYRVVDMVYNNRPSRMLFGEGGSPQSGMARDDDPDLLFDYNQRFLEMMMSQPLQRALVIGGGVMMLPKAAHDLFPGLTIDVVEIDSLLIDIARDYFDLPTSPRLNVHIADGLDFVNWSQDTYDMIIIDAFSSFIVPPHLINEPAVRKYHKILSPGGVVAINFISDYKPGKTSLAHQLIDTFGRCFTHVEMYQSDPEDKAGREQNMVLAASNIPLSLDYLQSVNIMR